MSKLQSMFHIPVCPTSEVVLALHEKSQPVQLSCIRKKKKGKAWVCNAIKDPKEQVTLNVTSIDRRQRQLAVMGTIVFEGRSVVAKAFIPKSGNPGYIAVY